MIESIINAKNLEEAEVVLVQAPYEETASSRKGTASGPKAIVDMLSSKLELFDRIYKMKPTDKIKIGTLDLGDLNYHSPEESLLKIKTDCEQLIGKNKFVVLLGGEQSVSLGLLQALSTKVDPKEVTILQIDAHCDLRENDADYSETPSRLAHSCTLRRAHELGCNLVQVGIRTYSIDEYNYFSDPKNQITVFEWGNGHQVPEISEILSAIKTQYVYLTIDADGFDPAYMPGTGTAVQGGLEWWYGVKLIEQLIDSKELIGADIVEVAPMQDSVLTEYGAAQLAYTIIAHKFQKNLK